MDRDDKTMQNLIQELKRGSLVLAVLLLIREPVYGYSMVVELQEKGLEVEQNTLYPLLRRLESQGLLESFWDTSESRPRKYYSLTDAGRETAELLKDEWSQLSGVLQGFIDASAIEGELS